MVDSLELFSLSWWEVVVAGIAVLAIYSFLYRENPFYRFFEHVFIGIATGITVMIPITNFLWPQILRPMLGFEVVQYPDGTLAQEYQQSYLLYLIPLGFGLLYYAILSKRYSWLAQLVIGFTLGIGGGLAFKGLLNEFLPQLTDSFRTLYEPGAPISANISNAIFVFVLCTVLSYFFFTFRRSPGGVAERSAITGRWMMMGCFGAFFGATIMARMALLVERLQFLIQGWWPAISQLVEA